MTSESHDCERAGAALHRVLAKRGCAERAHVASTPTVGVGGPVRWMVLPTHGGEVQRTVRLANQHGIPYVAVGRGSNLIVRDRGYDGIVMQAGGAHDRGAHQSAHGVWPRAEHRSQRSRAR